jgi:hypothetical protein
MKVFTNRTFKGLWPVGTAAVVVADTQEEAAKMLEKELNLIGLRQTIDIESMVEVDTSNQLIIILNDGNY